MLKKIENLPDELGECWDPLDGVRESWAAPGGNPVGGLPRGEFETGRIVSATEMSDCIGDGALPGLAGGAAFPPPDPLAVVEGG